MLLASHNRWKAASAQAGRQVGPASEALIGRPERQSLMRWFCEAVVQAGLAGQNMLENYQLASACWYKQLL